MKIRRHIRLIILLRSRNVTRNAARGSSKKNSKQLRADSGSRRETLSSSNPNKGS